MSTETRTAKVAPLSPQRYELHATLDQEAHDDLRHAQSLLGHHVPNADVAKVVGLALKALVRELEKRKFAATSRPRTQSKPSSDPRHIPNGVKRIVWQRDGGRCTFIGDKGHRCESRALLEFDHIEPVARGGTSTIANLRLRCRAHNQFEAERTFGVDFMSHKRLEAQRTAAQGYPRETATDTSAQALAYDTTKDVLAGLRSLGIRGERARAAAEHSATLVGAPLEEQMRAALRFIAPRAKKLLPSMAT